VKASDIEARTGGFLVQLDGAMAQSIERQGIVPSCRKGCDHCCYMFAETGIGEALHIAVEVARWEDRREVMRALFWHASEQTRPGMTKGKWFEQHVPCPFLTKDHLCRIYDRRPAACRCHIVVSPPENCALGAKDPITARLDVGVQALPHLQRLDSGYFADYPELDGPYVGLLTHMVLHALWFGLGGGDRRWLEKRLSKLPHPRDWSNAHVRAGMNSMVRP
jgi:Fe-S-cluster containining protein